MENIKHLYDLYRELSTKEFALANMLSAFASDDGTLKHNGKHIVGTELCEYLGDNYETFNRIMTSLSRKGVIGRVRVKSEFSYCTDYRVWVANPYIYEVGSAKNEIVEHFKNFKWD